MIYRGTGKTADSGPMKIVDSEEYSTALVTTAEVCDANPQLIVSDELRALEPVFQIYGRHKVFSGPVSTLTSFRRQRFGAGILKEKGNRGVLVVDGGGSLQCDIL
ncbi:hypothetical protein M8C21_023438, partial [Ambrosia artemisiifolia]